LQAIPQLQGVRIKAYKGNRNPRGFVSVSVKGLNTGAVVHVA